MEHSHGPAAAAADCGVGDGDDDVADTYTALTMCQALSYIYHMNHLILEVW